MLFVEQRNQHGIQPTDFTLTRGTGHEHVGHLGEVKDIRLIGDGLANGNGQGGIAVLELVAGNQRPHATPHRGLSWAPRCQWCRGLVWAR